MNNNRKHIEILLQRFFDGQSTLKEEEQLTQYFAQEQIPPEWNQYKRVFDHISSMQPQLDTKRHSFTASPWMKWVAAAACIAALFTIGIKWRAPQIHTSPDIHSHSEALNPMPKPVVTIDTIDKITPSKPNLAQASKQVKTSKQHRVKKSSSCADSVEIMRTNAELEQAEQEYIADQMLLEQELRCSQPGTSVQSGWITTSYNIQ